MNTYWGFVNLLILWSLKNANCQEGCREAGISSCCTGGHCQVPSNSLGSCFCDQTCYNKWDCCHDIEFICPLSYARYADCHDGREEVLGSGDEEVGSGNEEVGSGYADDGSGAIPPTTTVTPDRPPSFIHPPTNTSFEITPQSITNRRLFISLSVDLGHPPGRLMWTHNGILVSSRTDPRVTILAGGGLTIRNTQDSDSGTYRLMISNRAGNLTADLTVRSQYIEIVQSYGVIGNQVTFVCVARGNVASLYSRDWRTPSGGVLPNTLLDSFHIGGGEVAIQTFLEYVDPLDCTRNKRYTCEFGSGITGNDYTVSRAIDCPIIVPVDVRFQQSSYLVSEGVGMAEVCVTGTFYFNSASSVNITLSTLENLTSTALNGLDFRMTQRSFSLSRSNSIVCVGIEIVDDTTDEVELEDFFLTLTADNGLSNVSLPGTVSITIQDNDINFVFEESLYEVSEAVANKSLHLALEVCALHDNSRSSKSGTYFVDFTFSNGSATEGVDFVPSARRFEVYLELSTKTRVCDCIKLLPDSISEGDETFQVSLTLANSSTVLSSTIIKIVDDEYVRVTLERMEYIVTEGGPPLEVCILLEGELSTTVVLYLCTQNGTAKDIDDYEGLTSHRIDIAPRNLTSQRYCRDIRIIDDHIFEDKEVFSLELMSGPQNPPGMVKITPNAEATVTILDNEVPGAVFVNGTPSVHGTDVAISFVKSGPFTTISCTLKGPGKSLPITLPCTSGHVVFSDVPLRYQEFTFHAVGRMPGASTGINLLQRSFRLDSPVCSVHLINEGVRTLGSDSVSIEWAATGPSSEAKVSHFRCRMDKLRTMFNCTSPVVWRELTPGDHKLIVQPMPTPGCRRQISKNINFSL